MTEIPTKRIIEVERCWGINQYNLKGCPYARFMSYESGHFCTAANKDCWQVGPEDPKIEKDTDGFPLWCPLKKPLVPPECIQVPGNPPPKTPYTIYEWECEEIEKVNESLPTDELELKVRSLLWVVRTRDPVEPRHTLEYQMKRLAQYFIYGTCDGICDNCCLCDNAGGCIAPDPIGCPHHTSVAHTGDRVEPIKHFCRGTSIKDIITPDIVDAAFRAGQYSMKNKKLGDG
jgi:hypothetical protein